MITISVDAMGGDIGLDVTVPAAVAFLKQYHDVHLIMVGNQQQLETALKFHQAPMARITIQHASEVVEMDEAPQLALKNKKDSSMRVAINQVKEGVAQAAVSAGNTGALMATARFVLKTIKGIERPAIAKFLPTQGKTTLMLDLGANVDCTAEQLLQFAVLGSELVRALHPDAVQPKIGLLNIGTEEIKGTEVVKQTFALLKESPLNFGGNVEGDDVFSGQWDVVVADGFVGNVVLKTLEGSVQFLGRALKEEFQRNFFTKLGAVGAMPALKGFKHRFDPRRFNGAIFLGLRGIVIKSHGGTDEVGFAYSLEEAYHEARVASLEQLESGVIHTLSLCQIEKENQ